MISKELNIIGKDIIYLSKCLEKADKGDMNDLSIYLDELKTRLNEVDF